jgi:hypothetical protein
MNSPESPKCIKHERCSVLRDAPVKVSQWPNEKEISPGSVSWQTGENYFARGPLLAGYRFTINDSISS